MSTFAVIETGGKQYRVSPGEKIRVEKLPVEQGGDVVFDKVLLRHNDSATTIGTPYVEGAKVRGTAIVQGRDKKKIVFRYHSKTRYHKKKGHRQPFTEVRIAQID